jgi:hypothetical protein
MYVRDYLTRLHMSGLVFSMFCFKVWLLSKRAFPVTTRSLPELYKLGVTLPT